MDKPLERHLKIGEVTVGLIGLDIILNRLLPKKLDRLTALNELFDYISEQNYIPTGKEKLYKKALTKEYDRLISGGEKDENGITIRILGPGCVSCNNLQKMVIEKLNQLSLAADLFQVHDLDEIGRFGIIQTPALIINGQVKSAGRLPSSAKIEEWLREFV